MLFCLSLYFSQSKIKSNWHVQWCNGTVSKTNQIQNCHFKKFLFGINENNEYSQVLYNYDFIAFPRNKLTTSGFAYYEGCMFYVLSKKIAFFNNNRIIRSYFILRKVTIKTVKTMCDNMKYISDKLIWNVYNQAKFEIF